MTDTLTALDAAFLELEKFDLGVRAYGVEEGLEELRVLVPDIYNIPQETRF